jgi:hypothetical protein
MPLPHRPPRRTRPGLPTDLVFVVAEPLEKVLGDSKYNKSQFDILSNLTGYSGRRA